MAHIDFRARYGSWALIAGASEGLGAEFARQVAARGLHVILVARRQEVLERLAEQLRQDYGVQMRIFAQDLADEEAARRLVEQVQELEVGLLIYNAAISKIGLYLDIPLEDHLREIAANCRTPMALAYLLGHLMQARGRGGIILMSSMSASQGSPYIANYGATKAYNQVLAEGLWDELRARGVDVLAVLPAAVKTPNYLASQPAGAPSALEPGVVVAAALRALGKQPTVIPQWAYRLAGGFMQHVLTRKAAIRLMGTSTRSMYARKAGVR